MLEVRALYDKLNGKVCETQGRSLLVRAAGIEPARAFARRIFVPLRLSPPAPVRTVRGLDYPFVIARRP